MRSLEGQHSDRVAIKRTHEQKQRQLTQLREQLAGLKAHATPALRDSMSTRIAELEAELRSGAGASPARR